MSLTCPCCGHALREPLDVLALSSRIGSHPNTKTEQIVRVLVSRYPAGASNAELVRASHGGTNYGAPLTADNQVSVLVWRLRKHLKMYGWTITSAFRDGEYRLVQL